VRRAQPLQITLIGFPFKVPNPLKVGPRMLPDLAEVAALAALARLHQAVQAVYPPGLEIVIIHDGTYIADALDVPLSHARTYADYFGWLVRATGTDAFIRCADLAELMRTHGSGRGGSEGVGTDRTPPSVVRTHAQAVAFRKTLGMLNVRSIPAGTLSAAYQATLSGDNASLTGDAATLPMRAWRAMEQYEACDTLLHRFDPRPRAFPEAIHATTRSQPGRLALWLVRRGRSVLPWQGVGVVRGDRVEVRQAVDIQESSAYRPVFLEGETTPFCYEIPNRGA
jgi:pyoverdine/dityrosine biosynthesis protein Dit1